MCFLKLCREPFRLFFPLGILMAVWGLSPWLLYALKVIETPIPFFHSSMMILTYMNSFIIGFLLTAMPRFSGTARASAAEVFYFFILTLTTAVFLHLKQWLGAECLYILWLAGLLRFSLVRIKQRKRNESSGQTPPAMIWIPIAVLHGFIGTSLLVLGQTRIFPSWAILMGKPMMEQGFVLSIVLGIGGFLIPRLMGTREIFSRSITFHLLAAFLLFLSFVGEGMKQDVLGYGLRALVVTAEFIGGNILPGPPRSKDFYIKLIWISAWMTSLGLWLAAIFPLHHAAMLHVVFIGGFSLMTLSVGTMVSMTHSGAMEILRRPLWIFWMMGGAFLSALFKRVGVSFFPEAYFPFLGIAAFFWILGAVLWLCFISVYLVRFPEADEFEKIHEEAKKPLA